MLKITEFAAEQKKYFIFIFYSTQKSTPVKKYMFSCWKMMFSGNVCNAPAPDSMEHCYSKVKEKKLFPTYCKFYTLELKFYVNSMCKVYT